MGNLRRPIEKNILPRFGACAQSSFTTFERTWRTTQFHAESRSVMPAKVEKAGRAACGKMAYSMAPIMRFKYLSPLVKNNSPGSGLEIVAEENECNTRCRAPNASGDWFKRPKIFSVTSFEAVLFPFLFSSLPTQMRK